MPVEEQQVPRKRTRAVRLTTEGLTVLQDALSRAAGEATHDSLRRNDRASLLDVSAATADRILRCEGVDRSTLRAVFATLRLQWNDTYCEFVAAHQKGEPGTVPAAKAGRLRRWKLYACLVSVLCGSIGYIVFAVAPYVRLSLRRAELERLIESATRKYETSDYPGAIRDIVRAEGLAVYDKDGPQLARSEILHGQLLSEQGDFAGAITFFRQSMALRKGLHDDQCIPPLLENIGLAEDSLGQLSNAERDLRASLAGYSALNDKTGIALLLRDLGSLSAEKGDRARASAMLSQSESMATKLAQLPLVMDVRAREASLLSNAPEWPQARRILATCLAFWQHENHPRWIAKTKYQLGRIELASGNVQEARVLLKDSQQMFRNLNDKQGMHQCDLCLSGLQPSPRV
jgi:tetratricopeptide (TPR) repeat protein